MNYKEKIDIVEVVQKYVNLQKRGKYFVALCPFHRETKPSFYVSPELQIFKCFGCFPPGEKIKTPFGLHRIEEIDENHYVISGQGLIRRVIATHKRNYRGNIIKIKVRKLGGIVSLTEDHKIFIVRPLASYLKEHKNFYKRYRKYLSYLEEGLHELYFEKVAKYMPLIKLPAKEVRIGDFALYPINDHIHDIEKLDLRDYLTKTYTKGKHAKEIPYVVKADERFLKLVGYWIAEGSNHRAYIRFSLGKHEEDLAIEIVNLIKEIFGIEAKIHKRGGKKSGLEVTACHSYLANIFGNLCGRGAENKHIPFIFQELPPAKQMVLLNAIHRGDGTSFVANKSSKIHKSIGTISRVLAEQLVDILLRNGYYPSFGINKKRIDHLGVNHCESYYVIWSEEAKPRYNYLYFLPDGTKYWLLPIKEITKEFYSGPVYNLTVEEDHSYVATNFAVGNCGEGGDAIKFVMKKENLGYREALEKLGEWFGFQLKDEEVKEDLKRILNINYAALKFFRNQLDSRVKNYLYERGLNDKTIEKFEIGFSPGGTALRDYLYSIGFNYEDIKESGLLDFQNKDRFQSRIIFPLRDEKGRLVGFMGRIFPPDSQLGPKYLNSPETALFKKGQFLYGLVFAINPIQEKRRVILVEGTIDAILAQENGLEETVAVSGTSLTQDHLRKLKKYTTKIVFAFDNDEGGFRSLLRVNPLAIKAGFETECLIYEGAKDLADWLLNHSANDLKNH
jgi:intein/homing endonuclease